MSDFKKVKLFGIKSLGKGCRFGIKITSKKMDGTYTKGVFLNCKYPKEMLSEGLYDLDGFFGDNEYNDTNTLEFIVMTATMVGEAPQYQERAPQPKPTPKSTVPAIDIYEDEIPFSRG